MTNVASRITFLLAVIALSLLIGLQSLRAEESVKGLEALALSAEERAWLSAHPNLRLGDDFAWPPFAFLDEQGVYSGISSGYVASISKRLGIGIKPVLGLTWEQVLEKVKGGEVDMLPAVVRSKEREAFLNFTKPYISYPVVIATHREGPKILEIADLAGRKVGVVKGYITHESLAKDYPAINLIGFENLDAGLQSLDSDAIDAFVDNLGAITYEARRLRLANVKISAPTPYKFELSLATRKDWPELASLLDKSLEAMSSHEKSSIENTWLAVEIHFGVDVKTILLWVVPTGILGLIIFAAIIARNRGLRQNIDRNKRTEAALRDSETRFRAIIEASPVPIALNDEALNITYLNAAFTRTFGYTLDDIPTLAEWWPKAYPDPTYRQQVTKRWDVQLEKAVREKTQFEPMEVSVRCKNGSSRTVLAAAAPLGSWLEGDHLVTLYDITDRKRVERELVESEAHLRAIIWNEPECIKIVDERGCLAQMNPAGLAMIEADRFEQVAGLQVLDLVAPEHKDSFASMHERVLDGEAVQLEFEVIGLKGGRHWMETHAVPMLVNGKTVQLAVTRDVTERKRAQEEITRSNAELEQFGYAVSHDLRQPLRAINSYTSLIERKLGDKLDDEGRTFLHFVKDGALRMDHMLTSLLEYSRIGRSGEPMSLMESREAVEEALRFLSPAIADAHADIRIGQNFPKIMGSRDEMTRLFQNLIGNALKYRAPDRDLVVSVDVAPHAEGWKFSITDNGIGIDPSQIKRLFQVFQRLHTQDAYEGTGIGLAVCRKIVGRHGGRIWVESAGEGQGCSFCFTLPRSQERVA
ncbi:MAG: transporter substrate-binding domain-containing protein [Alphaproteobacteria bacterium]|nr:transporter substrate-binding domain-containing protein [Alphaproteobacteria bacterium]